MIKEIVERAVFAKLYRLQVQYDRDDVIAAAVLTIGAEIVQAIEAAQSQSIPTRGSEGAVPESVRTIAAQGERT